MNILGNRDSIEKQYRKIFYEKIKITYLKYKKYILKIFLDALQMSGICCNHRVGDSFSWRMADVRYIHVGNGYSRRTNDVENVDVRDYLLLMHQEHRWRKRREKVIPDALLVTRREKVSQLISSDGLPDVPFCIRNWFSDVFSTSIDVFIRWESPHFL